MLNTEIFYSLTASEQLERRIVLRLVEIPGTVLSTFSTKYDFTYTGNVESYRVGGLFQESASPTPISYRTLSSFQLQFTDPSQKRHAAAYRNVPSFREIAAALGGIVKQERTALPRPFLSTFPLFAVPPPSRPQAVQPARLFNFPAR